MFENRSDAGRKLSILLKRFKNEGVVVYTLPRGGVVVGGEVAKALSAPLDLVITRKISHPSSPEYAIGAVTQEGKAVLNTKGASTIDPTYLKEEIERQRKEALRRRNLYLGQRQPISCDGQVAIIVDDGVATGMTMEAAIKEIKSHHRPKKIIVAVPIIPADVVGNLENEGAEVIALDTPEYFLGAVGNYYRDFPQASDFEVLMLIERGGETNEVFPRGKNRV